MTQAGVVYESLGEAARDQDLAQFLPHGLLERAMADHQRVLPELARDAEWSRRIEDCARAVPSKHRVYSGDSRAMDAVLDNTVHLVLTSPPYWNLKPYEGGEGQLGLIGDYDAFVDQLDRVWRECYRVLVPGGRLVVVVGDVLLPRRRYGRHIVFPLHASIQERCRAIGFDNVAPIIWHKIGNAQLEVENGGRFLGKPYEPNAIIKNDIEYILFQRKAGGYRQPSLAARLLSLIPAEHHGRWFQQVWSIPGASTRSHPAPFPLELAERLIRMFSFVGDTVLDPFAGSGTTAVAALHWGRDTIGWEVEPAYVELAKRRMARESQQRRMVLRERR